MSKHIELQLPAFYPDATHGYIKSVGSDDLKANGVQGLVINTYHFLSDGNMDTVEDFGGLHQFINFQGPIITDSGGFQAMSLVRKNPGNGKFTEDGIIFKLEGKSDKLFLTPELCIETQFKLGSDIIMCLDDCTDPEEGIQEQEKSVERTIKWAKRCKDKYLELEKSTGRSPRILGIIQGGNIKELRKKCAEELIKIGFDGYAFGGWPVDKDKNFLTDIVNYIVSLMPQDGIKYAMGVGMPHDITACFKAGYNLFDCVLPTRDARHQRLYRFIKEDVFEDNFYDFVYISSGKFKNDKTPIDETCECTTCRNYSKAYLRHIFKIGDPLAYRLATIHNLHFYTKLMEKISKTA